MHIESRARPGRKKTRTPMYSLKRWVRPGRVVIAPDNHTKIPAHGHNYYGVYCRAVWLVGGTSAAYPTSCSVMLPWTSTLDNLNIERQCANPLSHVPCQKKTAASSRGSKGENIYRFDLPGSALVADVEGLAPFRAVDVPVSHGLCSVQPRAGRQQGDGLELGKGEVEVYRYPPGDTRDLALRRPPVGSAKYVRRDSDAGLVRTNTRCQWQPRKSRGRGESDSRGHVAFSF